MQTRPELERQMMRCGRLPPVPPDRLVRDSSGEVIGFEHNGLRRFRTMPKQDASTCAGLASTLPEVGEVVISYPQWKAGTLADWLCERPTPTLLTCLAMLEAGKNQCESDRIERDRKEAEARNGQ